MRLTDLHPAWWSVDGRRGQGINFDCPCGKCGLTVSIPINPPLDGGDHDPRGWSRSGETLETLSVTPSIFFHCEKNGTGGVGWHGFVTNGEVTTC